MSDDGEPLDPDLVALYARGSMLLDEYAESSTDPSIEEAIEIYGRLMAGIPVGSDPWLLSARMLGHAHFSRFSVRHEATDLSTAIKVLDAALCRVAPDNLSRPLLLKEQARNLYEGCVNMLCQTAALQTARDQLTKASNLLGENEPYQKVIKLWLARTLKLISVRNNSISEVDEAIEIWRELVTETVNDCTARDGLASALHHRYDNLRQEPDTIDEVIALRRDLLLATEPGSLASGWARLNLATALGSRYRSQARTQDRPEILVLLHAVLRSTAAARDIELTTKAARSLAWLSMAWSATSPDYATTAWVAEIGIGRLEYHLALHGPAGTQSLMDAMQGLASEGSYALAKLGRREEAVDMLERGCGLLESLYLPELGAAIPLDDPGHRESLRTYLLRREQIRTANETAADSPLAFADVHKNRETAERLLLAARIRLEARLQRRMRFRPSDVGRREPLLYVMATEIGGMAFLCSDKGIDAIPLDVLSARRVREWARRIRPLSNVEEPPFDADDGEANARDTRRSVSDHIEPVRGDLAPDPIVVRHAISWLREVLQPVLARMRSLDAVTEGPDDRDMVIRPAVTLVPSGAVAWLPVTAALTVSGKQLRPTAVTPSGRTYHFIVHRSPVSDKSGLLAVADPPIHIHGVSRPRLGGAAAEAEYLRLTFRARSLVGTKATQRAVARALGRRGGWLAVHIATHGVLDPLNPEASHFYLAGDRSIESETYQLKDLGAQRLSVRLVFLASCWLAQGHAALPDEALGFPRVLLRQGAQAVIAPLWPVTDKGAQSMVMQFYDQWLTHRRTPAEALAVTMGKAEEAGISDWGAFVLFGA